MNTPANRLHLDRPGVRSISRQLTCHPLPVPLDLWEINDLLVEMGARPDSLTIDQDGTANAVYHEENHRSTAIDPEHLDAIIQNMWGDYTKRLWSTDQ
jgi:hypothetical protein